jgi:TetR/AcrR family transcriptional regulator, transcriptional repressor for nem operon
MKLQTHRPSDIRPRIVRAAGDLFHVRGIRSTTTEEIIEAAGITKVEFHQHFKSKAELADALLRYHIEELAAGTGPLKYRLDTWSDLEECFASHVEFQKRFRMTRGCPIGRLGSELREDDELVRHSLNRAFDVMMTRLECLFSREKMAGRLASNVDIEQLANFCVVIVQGAMLTGKLRVDCRCVESIFEDLLSHLKRYAKAPKAPRKRLDEDGHAKQLSTRPKTSAPRTVIKLDSQNPGDCAEEHPVNQYRAKDEARISVGNPPTLFVRRQDF